jgi:hypothetical protein
MHCVVTNLELWKIVAKLQADFHQAGKTPRLFSRVPAKNMLDFLPA